VDNLLKSYIKSPQITVKFTSGMPFVWASLAYTYFNRSGSQIIIDSSPKAVQMDVWDATGAASLGTVTAGAVTLAGSSSIGSVFHGTLRRSFQLTADKAIHVRVYPIGVNSAGPGNRDENLFIRWIMLHVGADPNVPSIEGSHANKLWHLINKKLVELSDEPFTMTVRLADLAALNPDLFSKMLDIGQSVRVIASDMAGGNTVDVIARITSMKFDILEPLNTEVTLETIPPRFTTSLAKATARKLYVQINVGDDPLTADPGTVVNTDIRNTPTTSSAPTRSSGALRGIIGDGQQPFDPGVGPVPLLPFDPSALYG
jgi:hypothetical protein